VSGVSGCSGRSASEAEPFRMGWEFQHPLRYTLGGRQAWLRVFDAESRHGCDTRFRGKALSMP
jgi:hypothetical protein